MTVHLYSAAILLIYLRYRKNRLKVNAYRGDAQGHGRVPQVHCVKLSPFAAWAMELALRLFKSPTARERLGVDEGDALLRVERNLRTALVF